MPDWPSPSVSADPNKQVFSQPEAVVSKNPGQTQATQLPNRPQKLSETPYKDDVSHVIEGSGKPVKKPKKWPLKLLLFLIIVTVIGGLAGGIVILNNFKNDPLIIISESFENLSLANSFTAKLNFAQPQNVGKAEVIVDYHKAPFLFSRGQLKLNSIGGELGNNLLILAIFNATDSFVQANYSKIDVLDNQLNLLYPNFSSLETYQLILPVIKGQKWLHIKSPGETGADVPNKIQISEEKEKELNQKFLESIVIRSHDKDYQIGQIKYHRIILGFDKNKLISFIEALKTLDLDIELRQINSLIKVVQSVDNWNDDLIEILIEKETQNLYSLSLSIPKIPENALEQTIEESVKDEGPLSSFSTYFSQKASEFIIPPGSNNLVYIGNVELTNYNSAPSAQKPSPVVAQSEIERAFQNDLPYILQATLAPEQNIDTPYTIPDILNKENYDVLSASVSALFNEVK